MCQSLIDSIGVLTCVFCGLQDKQILGSLRMWIGLKHVVNYMVLIKNNEHGLELYNLVK